MTVPSPLGESRPEKALSSASKRTRSAIECEYMPEGYSAVPCAALLASSEGFYARYRRIAPESRRVVLIRVPRGVPTSALAGIHLRARPRSSGHVADLAFGDSAPRRRLVRGGSAEIPAALLVPAEDCLDEMRIAALDDMWTVCEDAAERPVLVGDPSVRMAEAATEGGCAIPQPRELRMRLSPFDLSTVLDK